ncbi:phosphoribosylaminoimidazole carboxylase catalytic subunit [Blattabacterium sp. (Blattella germanica) str. Bge]|uniref:5-(carboxyamino)imidazole ribonucleotide mutase n=1 Tax=Blattabacterium sp. (Blattella germanica) TaxID=624186 RepID=UPI0001BB6222|nr:5-(carboxyamino)imidazole ribonucleotide mutase [Blattabacterium sp. (Blattella germanica)]ACY40492.1 phosphoribosylaminoimidazole carboxylase catalytic subunit [Blattabacterium sp. (Blattella germanica) str. Bge]
MNVKVAIFIGSVSDKPTMKAATEILKKFNVHYTSYVISAHRLPDILSNTIKKIESEGTDLIIAGAGLSAHLPGIISSKTILPVIGVPIYHCNNGLLGGVDALLSMVQMPKDVPVATVGINNSYNAALLAIHILSIKNINLKKSLLEFRMKIRKKLANEIEQYL